jgi:hypothetical protein
LPKPVAYDTEVLRHELAQHPELVHAFPELTKAFPELAPGAGELAGGAAPLAGAAAGGGAVDRIEPGGLIGMVGPDGEVVPAPSAEVRAYNEVLGALAARGQAKTWRNPRGRAAHPPSLQPPSHPDQP